MLSGGLEARHLAQSQPVRDGKAGTVRKPHGKFAVEATPALTVKGGISGGSVASGHMRVLSESRGLFSQRLFTVRWAPGAVGAYAGWNTGRFTNQHALYRALPGRLSRRADTDAHVGFFHSMPTVNIYM